MDFVDFIRRNDRFANVNRIELVEADDTHALVRAPITSNSLNADDLAQGGFIFTIADMCFTYLSNHLHPRTVTQQATATYVAPAKGQWLYARGEELSATRHNNVVAVRVWDDAGKTVALFQFNGFIQPLA